MISSLGLVLVSMADCGRLDGCHDEAWGRSLEWCFFRREDSASLGTFQPWIFDSRDSSLRMSSLV